MTRPMRLCTTKATCGFTLFEVMLILLVVMLGVLGAVGLVSYGMVLASKAQGTSLGMPTAVAVANDPRPLLGAATASDWTYAPLNMDDVANNLTGSASGFINGFYVVRTEKSVPADVIATSGGKVYARYCSVAVDVHEAFHGKIVASFNTQIVRQRGAP